MLVSWCHCTPPCLHFMIAWIILYLIGCAICTIGSSSFQVSSSNREVDISPNLQILPYLNVGRFGNFSRIDVSKHSRPNWVLIPTDHMRKLKMSIWRRWKMFFHRYKPSVQHIHDRIYSVLKGLSFNTRWHPITRQRAVLFSSGGNRKRGFPSWYAVTQMAVSDLHWFSSDLHPIPVVSTIKSCAEHVAYYRNKKQHFLHLTCLSDLSSLKHSLANLLNGIFFFLLDNFSAHGTEETLPYFTTAFYNLEIRFLPPNTTSKLQPLGAYIIASINLWFKRYYMEHADIMAQ